ncbi:AI-2E family transporter [Paenibacillus polymyxa]|uniref:AI-2E family transporter n=1 Tax=Paenibacillus polymyxa TaxID=1406 RepID=UPI0025B6682E|nr:AI-2E family transporter [Paenibacillus polymyxa]MDN4081276.1 AI-2E family transporter [Paenibacillus polymyxa]MDN4106979.1 AI-2E family transporter [Paenibacillus polymyxa]MDN4116935.1 AI-2E family transporter [Paenibacillus polymyxa]
MDRNRVRPERFKQYFLSNKIVLLLLIVLLIGVIIFVFDKVAFIFSPLAVLVKTIILPVILSGVLYYLLTPIVDRMEKWKISRGWSILILYLVIGGGITVAILTVIPVLQNQVTGLINNFPSFSNNIRLQFGEWMNTPFFNQFQGFVDWNSDDWWSSLTEKTTGFLNGFLSSISGFLGVFVETVVSIITVPFILFYLLKDGKKLPHKMLSFLPIKSRSGTMHVLTDMNHQISTFIRSQIIISFSIGALLYIGYLIIGLDYALVLAIVASLTSVVPYLGPAIAIMPALIVALVTSPIMLLKMVAVWTIVQLIEGKLISPQIMGKTLNIHPITIIFVILTSGNLFGVLGVLLAVPGYAVLKVCAVHLFNWFKDKSGLYISNDEHREDTSNH